VRPPGLPGDPAVRPLGLPGDPAVRPPGLPGDPAGRPPRPGLRPSALGITPLGVFLFCYADAAGEGGAGREFGGGRVVDLFEGQAVRRYDPDGRVPDRCR
jgi:hypothetical protein